VIAVLRALARRSAFTTGTRYYNIIIVVHDKHTDEMLFIKLAKGGA